MDATAPPETPAPGTLRHAVTAATLRPEPDCLPPLIEAATPGEAHHALSSRISRASVEALRAKGAPDGVSGRVQEYARSTGSGSNRACRKS